MQEVSWRCAEGLHKHRLMVERMKVDEEEWSSRPGGAVGSSR